jgi:hypothetical protein
MTRITLDLCHNDQLVDEPLRLEAIEPSSYFLSNQTLNRSVLYFLYIYFGCCQSSIVNKYNFRCDVSFYYYLSMSIPILNDFMHDSLEKSSQTSLNKKSNKMILKIA